MKYSEFENFIDRLGDNYTCYKGNGGGIFITYRGEKALHVGTHYPFVLDSYSFFVENCPKKSKIWNMASVLAGTPLNEREEENKYNVIIAFNGSNTYPFTVWSKIVDNFEINSVKKTSLESQNAPSCFQFTDTEFEDLIKYIKHLPDGEFQAKVAEHGKTLVKGD